MRFSGRVYISSLSESADHHKDVETVDENYNGNPFGTPVYGSDRFCQKLNRILNICYQGSSARCNLEYIKAFSEKDFDYPGALIGIGWLDHGKCEVSYKFVDWSDDDCVYILNHEAVHAKYKTADEQLCWLEANKATMELGYRHNFPYPQEQYA